MSMSTSLSIAGATGDLMSSPAALEHGLKLAEIFAQSSLIPPHLRGKTADVLMAIAIAQQLGISPLIVMQSLYVVAGRAGWNAQFMIALANSSGKFRGPIQWRNTAAPGAADFAVTAYAALCGSGDEVTATASIAMAIAEGWTKNAKYKSMPEHMLRLRSATLLVRLYVPEVMLGIATSDEVLDSEPAQGDPPHVLPPPSPPRPSEPTSVVAQVPSVRADAGPARGGGPAADPLQTERDSLIAAIRELGAELPDVTKKQLLKAAGLDKIAKSSPIEQLRDLRAKMLAAILEMSQPNDGGDEPLAIAHAADKWSDKERKEFFGALGRMDRPVKDKYEVIAAYCETHYLPRPSLMSADARVQFVASLAGGDVRLEFDEWCATYGEGSDE